MDTVFNLNSENVWPLSNLLLRIGVSYYILRTVIFIYLPHLGYEGISIFETM